MEEERRKGEGEGLEERGGGGEWVVVSYRHCFLWEMGNGKKGGDLVLGGSEVREIPVITLGLGRCTCTCTRIQGTFCIFKVLGVWEIS